jgi:hypothetical protein
MIQTKHRSLYVCEIKFSKNVISHNIITEVQQKINALQGIKNFSYRPVLIYIGEIRKDIKSSDYFVKIIDFCKLIENRTQQ